MIILSHISLTQFKNYTASQFTFDSLVACITGPNGAGKTNLLDAIYYLCYTKSYFSHIQQLSVQSGAQGFRIDGQFYHRSAKNESELVSVKWKGGVKEVFLNQALYERPSDHIGRYRSVMIAPDDIMMINGGGEARRKWLDAVIAQCDRSYLESLLCYQRILLQRNALLKSETVAQTLASNPQMDYYNSQLATHGDYLHQARVSFIDAFQKHLAHFYRRLTDGAEWPTIHYQSDVTGTSMIAVIGLAQQNDYRMQRTTRGIHRDDLLFKFNDLDLKQFGSQGQKKSFLFGLKLAQYRYLCAFQPQKPLLLLDDVFEKLDQSRIEALLEIIQGEDFGQVVLTDTDADRVRRAFGNHPALSFIFL